MRSVLYMCKCVEDGACTGTHVGQYIGREKNIFRYEMCVNKKYFAMELLVHNLHRYFWTDNFNKGYKPH